MTPCYARHACSSFSGVARCAALRDGQDEAGATVMADAAMILIARDRQRADPALPPEGTYAPVRRGQELIPVSLALTSPALPDLLGRLTPLTKGRPS